MKTVSHQNLKNGQNRIDLDVQNKIALAEKAIYVNRAVKRVVYDLGTRRNYHLKMAEYLNEKIEDIREEYDISTRGKNGHKNNN